MDIPQTARARAVFVKITENSIKQLPLRGRNAFELVLLTPGAQQRDGDE